jgi:hypothetical protein
MPHQPGQLRWSANDLVAPQLNGALFLALHDALRYVRRLEPGLWDWRCACPVGMGHPPL